MHASALIYFPQCANPNCPVATHAPRAYQPPLAQRRQNVAATVVKRKSHLTNATALKSSLSFVSWSPLLSKIPFLWFLGCVPVQILLLILPSTFFIFLYFGAGNMAQDQLFARFQRADVGDAWERDESCAGHILSIETRNVTNRVRVAH